MIVPLGLLCLDFQGSDIGPSWSSCFISDRLSRFTVITLIKHILLHKERKDQTQVITALERPLPVITASLAHVTLAYLRTKNK